MGEAIRRGETEYKEWDFEVFNQTVDVKARSLMTEFSPGKFFADSQLNPDDIDADIIVMVWLRQLFASPSCRGTRVRSATANARHHSRRPTRNRHEGREVATRIPESGQRPVAVVSAGTGERTTKVDGQVWGPLRPQ